MTSTICQEPTRGCTEQLQPLRAVLNDGNTPLGARVGTFSPESTEVYGDLGLDYAWLDFEHGWGCGYDSNQLTQFVRAAASADIDPLARLGRHRFPGGTASHVAPAVETADYFEIGGEVSAARAVLSDRLDSCYEGG